MPLGRKQSIPDLSTWTRAMDEIVPGPWLDELFDRTVADVRRFVRGKRVAFGWSGGKDSLVLQRVMEAAGVAECVLVISNLEYPAFLQWATDFMPDGLEIVNTGQGYEWLRAHPAMLFPQGRFGPEWFSIVQHTGQASYYASHRLDALALGRRRSDGNYVGRGSNIYTNRQGVTRWSPLADWSHEAVLALLKRDRIVLPPCYEWPRGFQIGTGPWPARQWTRDRAHGWAEVWSIDPDVVRAAAANQIPGASDFLMEQG